MNLRLIISDAFLFYKNHLRQICALCLPWILLIVLMDYVIRSIVGTTQESLPVMFLLTQVFMQLIYPIYTGGLILLMAKRARLEQPDNLTLIVSALKIWQPFFILRILSALLTMVGLFFFFIGAVFVGVCIIFADFYLVVENDAPLDAIKKSFKTTLSWELFFEILLLMALLLLPFLIINLYIANVISSTGGGYIITAVVSAIMHLLYLFVDVVRFRLYMYVKETRGA